MGKFRLFKVAPLRCQFEVQHPAVSTGRRGWRIHGAKAYLTMENCGFTEGNGVFTLSLRKMMDWLAFSLWLDSWRWMARERERERDLGKMRM